MSPNRRVTSRKTDAKNPHDAFIVRIDNSPASPCHSRISGNPDLNQDRTIMIFHYWLLRDKLRKAKKGVKKWEKGCKENKGRTLNKPSAIFLIPHWMFSAIHRHL